MKNFMIRSVWLAMAAIALGLMVSACNVQPKAFTSKDDCRDCPPGLFSGEEGEIVWEF